MKIVQEEYREFAGLGRFHRFREDDWSFMLRFHDFDDWQELYLAICDEAERVLTFGE